MWGHDYPHVGTFLVLKLRIMVEHTLSYQIPFVTACNILLSVKCYIKTDTCSSDIYGVSKVPYARLKNIKTGVCLWNNMSHVCHPGHKVKVTRWSRLPSSESTWPKQKTYQIMTTAHCTDHKLQRRLKFAERYTDRWRGIKNW